MSEPIPESIPTSADPQSQARHAKKRRIAVTPASQQAAQLSSLFKNPDHEIRIPSSSSNSTRSVPAPPEIVANVQGSSAGAGSGEFHVYKASRRREYERVKNMEEQVLREERDKEFGEKKEEWRIKDEGRTGKNRRRREKARLRKGGKGEVSENKTEAMGIGIGAGVNDETKMGKDADMEGVEETAPTQDSGLVIHDDD